MIDYVIDGHGNVVALTDASGTPVATYAYDEFGAVTVDTEHFSNGWRNPYLFDGMQGVRYDATTQMDWMSVRAYDPSIGRFISRDPLGRTPLFGLSTQPYVYTDNSPLTYTDPSGQMLSDGAGHYAAPAKNTGHPATAPATPSPTAGKQPSKSSTQTKHQCTGECRWKNGKSVALRLVTALKSLGGCVIVFLILSHQLDDALHEQLAGALNTFKNLAGLMYKLGEATSGLANAIGLFASIFGWINNPVVQTIFTDLSLASAGLNSFAGTILSIIGGGAGFWQNAVKILAAAAVTGFKAMWSGQEAMSWGALFQVLMYVGKMFLKVDLMTLGLTILGQAMYDGFGALLDTIYTESPKDFCHGHLSFLALGNC